MNDLLLLHGALGSPAHMDFIEEALSSQFRIHKLRLIGHADPHWTAQAIHMQDFVNQIKSYCQKSQLQSVQIFGYSMGGYAALLYASQYPETVSKVMTLAVKLDWTPESAAREAQLLQPDVLEQKVPAFTAQLAERHGSENWKALMLRIVDLLHELGQKPLLTAETLAHIQAEVQMMVGDKDNMVSISETLEHVRHIPRHHIAILPQTVHPFERINKDLLLQLMRDFFK